MNLTTKYSFLAAAMLVGTGAMAQAKAPEPDYTLSYNIGVVSDYRFRGLTQANYGGALQGGIDFAHKSGFYIGTWASNVSWVKQFNGATNGDWELDLYGGFKGGWVDDVLNVVTNLFIVIPQFVVLILISSSMTTGRSLTLIALIIGATGWTWSARAVRAQAAALKSRDHISLARINGDGTLAILVKHILPYLLSYVFMVFIIQIASGILSESAISMLGLGPLDTQSLGIILNDAKANGALSDGCWWGIFPATILITTIVFALYLINTSMEGVFNPRLRRE